MSEPAAFADLVDPAELPGCVPRELFDGCSRTFSALTHLIDRPSGVRERGPRVAITGSPSLMCKLQVTDTGESLVVVPLGLIARVYTLALILETHRSGLQAFFVGDEPELARLLRPPARIAALFGRSDGSGAFWERLGEIQESFGARGEGPAEAARMTALLATGFFVCHEVGHWVRMHDSVGRLPRTGEEARATGLPLSELRRGIEISADVSGTVILTSLVTKFPDLVWRAPPPVRARWADLLYAVAVGFSLFEVHVQEGPEAGPGTYEDVVIRHQICIEASGLVAEAEGPEALEDWDTAEREAWLRYRERFSAFQAASAAGRYGPSGDEGIGAPHDLLSRSGSPELLSALVAARELHDRVVAAVQEIQRSAGPGESGTGFDEESLHRGVEMVPSCDVGTSLMRRWKAGEAGAHRVGAAIVSAVVDVRRIGYRGDLTPGDVGALCRHYLPDGTADVPQETYAAEMRWANERIGGVASCVLHVESRTFEAAPALIAAVRDGEPGRNVPKQVWQWLVEHTDDADQLFTVAAHAIWRRNLALAEQALDKIERGGEQPEIVAMWRGMIEDLRGNAGKEMAHYQHALRIGEAPHALFRLAELHLRTGGLDEAEALLRPLADEGHPAAMCDMGLIEERRGRMASAKRWWVRSSAAGDTRASNNLGKCALEEGDVEGAGRWFAIAAEVGDLLALYNQGVLADMRGDAGDAETWWRIAADSGSTDAMRELGRLLTAQGRDAEAAAWWRHAASVAGRQLVADPAFRDERLALGETLKQWDDRVSDAQEAGSVRNYGLLLAMSGDLAGAIVAMERARDGGDREAAEFLDRVAATPAPPERRRRRFLFGRRS
ncbi:hypothetical protein GCM10010517_62720 [Streptosporangium fragile]|uniref:Sel1 repeat family protein n=1 Tax=Streptosporangium fragile TaxID=46186 RepID=A0ABP6IPA2_9ACTN